MGKQEHSSKPAESTWGATSPTNNLSSTTLRQSNPNEQVPSASEMHHSMKQQNTAHDMYSAHGSHLRSLAGHPARLSSVLQDAASVRQRPMGPPPPSPPLCGVTRCGSGLWVSGLVSLNLAQPQPTQALRPNPFRWDCTAQAQKQTHTHTHTHTRTHTHTHTTRSEHSSTS